MSMEEERLESVWGSVSSPIIVFHKDDPLEPVYENQEMRLMRKGKPFFEMLAPKEAEALCFEIPRRGERRAPLFCHMEKKVYSAVLFDWEEYCSCILHDVSQYYYHNQKELEEAQLANRAKTNFLSAMSHDIRTPMNAIVGMTNIALMQDDIPLKVQDCLDKIRVASGHMMSLLNDVLDMSRIESGKILLQVEDLDVADLLHEILIVARPQTDGKKQHFHVEIGHMEKERIQADGMRLAQICNNLLSNATKFTPKGGEIRLFLEVSRLTYRPLSRDAEGKEYVLRIQVEDDGIGMEKEFLPRIFQPFERERTMTVSKIQGTGLGMAITQSLVKMMGGHIQVESQVGEGTCFTIEIPVDAAADAQNLHSQALEGKRILLLDDDEQQGQVLVDMLHSLGMQWDWARTAEEAVDDLNESVFLDKEYFAFLTAEKIQNVEMMDFLPEIRKRMGSQFPMLMLYGDDWSQTEYLLTRAGVDAFIPLPLFRSRLLAGLYSFTEEYRVEEARKQKLAEVDFARYRILLVEDNELNREIAQEILQLTGMGVEHAANGKEAVEKFSRSEPHYYDMILMDIQMPVMDGLEATRQIRALSRPDAAKVPIVAMTANAFLEDVKDSLEAGMNAHISKPLDMDQVYNCIKLFLGEETV